MFVKIRGYVHYFIFSLMAVAGILVFCVDAFADSLEKKIGQMIMVGFRGLELTEDTMIVEDITRHGIGGVILYDYDVQKGVFERNIKSPDQLKGLINSLKSLPGGDGLLIAVRHEGGDNTVLKERYGFNRSVSQGHLGKNDNISLTMKYSLDSAQYLSELGINLNLAPVIDLDARDKSNEMHGHGKYFSHDPDVVVEHAWEVINAHRIFKVLTAVKYFPGHGIAGNDFHQGFVDVSKSWDAKELLPYQELIADPGCDMVMVGHIFNRRLDPDWPASLSEKTINGILRQRLGYEGVIISADIQVPGIRDNYSLETVLERTILAGVDILVFGNNLIYEPDIVNRSIETIMELIDQGRISKSRINDSYDRISDLKARFKPLVESDCSFCLE
jgi:beta-N-acetylhexosaminidase